MAVTHATTTAEPDDPTYDVSADAWNQAHTTADGSFVAAKLAASATDVLFGRSTAGAGNGQEIAATAAGRALLDDANAAAQLVTLGVGTDAAAGTGSMRTLGTGATQAAAGNHAHTTELDYVEITTPVALTATTEGTAHTVITGTSQAYAAVPIIINFFCPAMNTPNDAAGRAVIALLYDGATLLGRIATVITPAAAQLRVPILGQRRLTPTAATHQYIIKAYVSGGSGSIDAGAGGTGANLAAYLRITLA